MYNATNLRLVDGGIKIKQGDKSSNYSFELQDENEKAINLDDKNATVLLVKDGEVKYKKVVKVSGSIVSFTIDKFLEVGKYPLEIHCDGYVFPSNDGIKINVVKSFVSEEVVEEDDEKEKEVEKSFDNSYLEKYFEKYPSLNRDLVFDYTIFDVLSDEEIFNKVKELIKPIECLWDYNVFQYYEGLEDIRPLIEVAINSSLLEFVQGFNFEDMNRFYTKHDKNIFLQYLDLLLRVPLKLKMIDFSTSYGFDYKKFMVVAVPEVIKGNFTWEVVSGSEHLQILGGAVKSDGGMDSVQVGSEYFNSSESIPGVTNTRAILIRSLGEGTVVIRVTETSSGLFKEETFATY